MCPSMNLMGCWKNIASHIICAVDVRVNLDHIDVVRGMSYLKKISAVFIDLKYTLS